MIHRCETCPFWKAPPPNQEWGYCRMASVSDRPQLYEPEVRLAAAPIMQTHPKFGCVMHPMNKAIA